MSKPSLLGSLRAQYDKPPEPDAFDLESLMESQPDQSAAPVPEADVIGKVAGQVAEVAKAEPQETSVQPDLSGAKLTSYADEAKASTQAQSEPEIDAPEIEVEGTEVGVPTEPDEATEAHGLDAEVAAPEPAMPPSMPPASEPPAAGVAPPAPNPGVTQDAPVAAPEMSPEEKILAMLEPKIGKERVEVLRSLEPNDRKRQLDKLVDRYMDGDDLSKAGNEVQQAPAGPLAHLLYSAGRMVSTMFAQKKVIAAHEAATKAGDAAKKSSDSVAGQVMPAKDFGRVADRGMIDALETSFRDAESAIAQIESNPAIAPLLKRKAEHAANKPLGADTEWGAQGAQLKSDLSDALRSNPEVNQLLLQSSAELTRSVAALKAIEAQGGTHEPGDNIPSSEEVNALSQRMEELSGGMNEESREKLQEQMKKFAEALEKLFERFRSRFGMGQGAGPSSGPGQN